MPVPEDHRVGDDEAPEGSLGWLLWVLFGTVVLAVPQITEVRLRRVPLGGPRPPRRAGRPGRLSIRPIRLRVVAGEETLQLTVACWRHWADLVERILIVTGIEADVRTLGRIERYG